MNQGLAFGAECSDAEGHGDAMVATGIDNSAMELLPARDVETIFEFFDFSTHGAEIACDQSDAIGLLDAELLCVADANAAACIRADRGEDGEFVDELRSECAADGSGTEAAGICSDLNRADEFGMRFLELKYGDARAKRGEDVKERGAGGVEADAVEDEA